MLIIFARTNSAWTRLFRLSRWSVESLRHCLKCSFMGLSEGKNKHSSPNPQPALLPTTKSSQSVLHWIRHSLCCDRGCPHDLCDSGGSAEQKGYSCSSAVWLIIKCVEEWQGRRKEELLHTVSKRTSHTDGTARTRAIGQRVTQGFNWRRYKGWTPDINQSGETKGGLSQEQTG